MNQPGDDFRDRMARVGDLVRAIESLPDAAAREAARELTRCLLDLHAEGFKRVLELTSAETTGQLADDSLVGSLLLLHGLHPKPPMERVNRAMEQARARLRATGGDVDVLSATEEVVRLQLRGDPDAGPTLRSLAEEVVVAAVPDVAALEFEEAWDRPAVGRAPLPLVTTGGAR